MENNIKKFIKSHLGEIKFEKHFDKLIKVLKQGDIKDLKKFILDCKEKNYRPAVTSVGDLAFVKKLGGSKRCVILKIKNGEFKEIFLGEHKYYDYFRKKIGLK